MGYDRELFVDPVDDNMCCAICNDVFRDPQNSPCAHVFCKDCIRRSAGRQNTWPCPMCRTMISVDKLCPSIVIQGYLDSKRIRCPFQGCPHICQLDQLRNHQISCLYNPELDDDQLVQCSNDCQLEMTRKQFRQHNCTVELKNRYDQMNETVLELERKVSQLTDELNMSDRSLIVKDIVKEMAIQLKPIYSSLKPVEDKLEILVNRPAGSASNESAESGIGRSTGRTISYSEQLVNDLLEAQMELETLKQDNDVYKSKNEGLRERCIALEDEKTALQIENNKIKKELAQLKRKAPGSEIIPNGTIQLPTNSLGSSIPWRINEPVNSEPTTDSIVPSFADLAAGLSSAPQQHGQILAMGTFGDGYPSLRSLTPPAKRSESSSVFGGKRRLPQIRILDLPMDDDQDTLMFEIKRRNDAIRQLMERGEKFEFVRFVERAHNKVAIFTCSPGMRNSLLTLGKLYAGSGIFRVEDNVFITQCSNCGGYNHTAYANNDPLRPYCKNPRVCLNCNSQEHSEKNCRAEKHCPACSRSPDPNIRTKASSHGGYDYDSCPAFERYRLSLLDSTDYGSGPLPKLDSFLIRTA